jgi:hypothetical protein
VVDAIGPEVYPQDSAVNALEWLQNPKNFVFFGE